MMGELFADFLERKTPRFRRSSAPPKPWLSIAKYSIFGVVAGALSLLLMPSSFIEQKWLGYLHLAIMPFVAGWVMMQIGLWHRRKGNPETGLESFMSGYAFALCMGLVRFAWAY